jgi:hypothetical protein
MRHWDRKYFNTRATLCEALIYSRKDVTALRSVALPLWDFQDDAIEHQFGFAESFSGGEDKVVFGLVIGSEGRPIGRSADHPAAFLAEDFSGGVHQEHGGPRAFDFLGIGVLHVHLDDGFLASDFGLGHIDSQRGVARRRGQKEAHQQACSEKRNSISISNFNPIV